MKRDALGRSIEPSDFEWETHVETMVNTLGEKAYVAYIVKGDSKWIYARNTVDTKTWMRVEFHTRSTKPRRILLKSPHKALRLANREVQRRKREEWEKLRDNWQPED